MSRAHTLATMLALATTVSCASTPAKPAATPAPTTVAMPAPPPTAVVGGRGGAPTGVPGTPGGAPRVPLTPEQNVVRRDSLARLRAASVAEVLATIAGRENEPAGQVFKNVQLMKDMPAGKFVVAMDSTFGRALSNNCTSCHVANNYADDTRQGKVRARIMISMVDAINKEHLSKLPAGRGGSTPIVTCITCHRGVGGNPGRAMVP